MPRVLSLGLRTPHNRKGTVSTAPRAISSANTYRDGLVIILKNSMLFSVI